MPTEEKKDQGKDKDLTKKEKKVKVLDTNTIIMIICLAFIFSLTILNKTGVLTNWVLYVLLVVFLAIMIYILMVSIKKNKEIKEEIKS